MFTIAFTFFPKALSDFFFLSRGQSPLVFYLAYSAAVPGGNFKHSSAETSDTFFCIDYELYTFWNHYKLYTCGSVFLSHCAYQFICKKWLLINGATSG